MRNIGVILLTAVSWVVFFFVWALLLGLYPWPVLIVTVTVVAVICVSIIVRRKRNDV